MAEAGKMEKARAALLYGIRILRPQDRFNVISFAGEERLMESRMITADDEGRKRGEAFAQSLRPVGGTNINQALLAAMQQFEAGNRPKILVFMTDGLPTVDYVEPKEDIEVKVSNFFAKVNYPVLTDLKLDMAGVATDLVYPRALPDLFRGSQIVLIGRYRNPIDLAAVRLQLGGNAAGANKNFFFNNLHFPLREEANDFLPRLWATRRVGWLMEQVRSNGEQPELRDEIVDLGTRYGIVTPYTSYLALEPEAFATNVTTRPIDRRGFGAGRANNAPPAPAKAADVNATTGAVAVQQSKRAREQQEVMRVETEKDSSAIKTAGGKTFYLREDVWTDAELKAGATMPETVVKFGSDEYFALLKQKPKLAAFFALGERVVVILDGRIYRVNAAN
jgi:Ca-activated chloride channel family protein